MDHILLTKEPLDVNKVNNLVAQDSCGAISIFVGTTRDNFEEKKVLSLEYEAYVPMAEKEMKNICSELRGLWSDLENIAIFHRLGLVPVREASVIIACSAPHRKSALEATNLAIEELKRRVPIWKKEKYENDESAWKENKECSSDVKPLRKKLNLTDCTVVNMQDLKNFVQISVPESELNRRIESFVGKKRQQNDLSNIADFISKAPESGEAQSLDGSCARTNSFIVKQAHFKGHLKVQRAANNIGPQTRPDYLLAFNKHTHNTKLKQETCETIPLKRVPNDRLSTIEEFIRIPDSDLKTVHDRLKAIENRILFLESISPEYSHFMTDIGLPTTTKTKGKSYTIEQLNDIIDKYERVNSDMEGLVKDAC